MNIVEGDPAAERFETLTAALGHPVLSAYEAAVLVRLVSWSTADDIGALARIIRAAITEGGNQ
jgi:hypothetical protein